MKLRSVFAALLVCVGAAGSASASSLTILDTFRGNGVTQDASLSSVAWTLTTEDNCVQCDVLLTARFSGTNNYYVGTYLDSVQWQVSSPSAEPQSVGYSGFYANGVLDPQWKQKWSFAIDQSLNANQCNGSSSAHDAVCGEWVYGGVGGGYGAITAGTLLAWTFRTTFEDTLPVALRGNIRAAFNNSAGRNRNIFSPGGGSFVDGGCAKVDGCVPPPPPPPVVPEPASLVLMGSGMAVLATLLQRRRRNRLRADGQDGTTTVA